jgi:uridine kinase
LWYIDEEVVIIIPLEVTVMSKIDWVIKRSGVKVPFNPDRITNAIYRAAVSVGGRDRSMAENLSSQVVRLLEAKTPPDHVPHIEEIQDLVEKVLIEGGHARVAKVYILYRDERTRARNERLLPSLHPSDMIPWAKIWHVLDWAVAHDIHTVEKYNARLARGETTEIIIESEAQYAEDVENAASLIAERIKTLKIVIITGPSSSGKTTTTCKIGIHLNRLGFNLVTLNLDNYFYDLEMHPKDEFGDYDFETPQAMDMNLINTHLHSLIRGDEIKMPYYDFKTGKRAPQTTPVKLRPNDIILIDSLHGLFPDLTAGIQPDLIFKLYLEPLLQMKDSQGNYIRWTDIRLMRRMLRDASHRAYNPQKTLEHWHYVRTSEMRNIIPNINTTDYIINSSMPFELSIYKPKLIQQFESWAEQYAGDPLREDAYQRALRTRDMLRSFTPIENDSVVPPDSVIREFIGGSVYKV